MKIEAYELQNEVTPLNDVIGVFAVDAEAEDNWDLRDILPSGPSTRGPVSASTPGISQRNVPCVA